MIIHAADSLFWLDLPYVSVMRNSSLREDERDISIAVLIIQMAQLSLIVHIILEVS